MRGTFAEITATVLVTTLVAASVTEAKRVLLYPFPGTSHVLTFVKVGKALAEMDHEVYICMPKSVYEKTFQNNTHFKPILFGNRYEDYEQLYLHRTETMEKLWEDGDDTGISNLYFLMQRVNVAISMLRETFADSSFILEVQQVEPDLMIFDSLPHHRSALALAYRFDIPFILMGYYDAAAARIPVDANTTPHPTLRNFSLAPTLFQRMKLILFNTALRLYDLGWDCNVLETVAPGQSCIFSFWDIASKAELYIFETDHLKDTVLPMLPNTKLVGGMSPSPARPLIESLSAFINNSQAGAAFVSFGTTSFNLPDKIFSKMSLAFHDLNLRVIWRVNASSPDPNNILTVTWVPQNDLLGHAGIKIFVSHCGTWGVYEAIYHAVPILCLPLFADQFHNANEVESHGFGLKADVRTVSSQDLSNLIKEIISNAAYQDAIARASEIYRQLYKVPAEEAAFWIDHVMQHGGSYMRSDGQKMPYYQYMCLDLILAFIFCIIAVWVVYLYFVVRFSLLTKPKLE